MFYVGTFKYIKKKNFKNIFINTSIRHSNVGFVTKLASSFGKVFMAIKSTKVVIERSNKYFVFYIDSFIT